MLTEQDVHQVCKLVAGAVDVTSARLANSECVHCSYIGLCSASGAAQQEPSVNGRSGADNLRHSGAWHALRRGCGAGRGMLCAEVFATISRFLLQKEGAAV